MSGNQAKIEVLIVEDSRAHADLMVRALLDGGLDYDITVLGDGEKAMAYLQRKGEHAAAPMPDLILLDLHLPRMDGREVLASIKKNANLRMIPIVVLTATEKDDVILDVYELHANCCVCKPADQEQFALAVKKIEQFWLRNAQRRP